MRILGTNRRNFHAEEALQDERILCRVQDYIDAVNRKLNHWERIKKWTLVAEPLSVESGLLTPTFKLRRKAVEARFAQEIERMYLPSGG